MKGDVWQGIALKENSRDTLEITLTVINFLTFSHENIEKKEIIQLGVPVFLNFGILAPPLLQKFSALGGPWPPWPPLPGHHWLHVWLSVKFTLRLCTIFSVKKPCCEGYSLNR